MQSVQQQEDCSVEVEHLSAPNSTIQLITIASKGDATTFGDLTETRGQLGGGVSDGIRGVETEVPVVRSRKKELIM